MKRAALLVVVQIPGLKYQSDTINIDINFYQFLTNSALRAFQTLHVNLFVSNTTSI